MFVPGVQVDLDQIVRDELAASVEYLADRVENLVAGFESNIGQIIQDIRRHRLDPTVFARYYELVLAVRQGNRDVVVRLFRDLAERARIDVSFVTQRFDDPALEDEASRYLRWLSPGQLDGLVDAPNHDQWSCFATHMPAALQLIDVADPNLAAELHGCVIRVIGASANPKASRTFGGASSFMLWGAVFLNVALHRTRTEIAIGLVHESAHQVLFALSCREPLVENALEARFVSPLRRDPRPIIGVYHATFVCARMCYALRAMLGCECRLDDGERVSLIEQRDKARTNFCDGVATLRQSGHLTDYGRHILDEAAVSLELN